MPFAEYDFDGAYFRRLCTNTAEHKRDGAAKCKACVIPFLNFRQEPCLQPSEHWDKMAPYYIIELEGGYSIADVWPNWSFQFPQNIDLNNSFPWPNSSLGGFNVIQIGHATRYAERPASGGWGPKLFWGASGSQKFTSTYPDVGCGYSANRRFPDTSDGSQNVGYGSQMTFNDSTMEWEVDVELQNAANGQQFLPQFTIPDSDFNPAAIRTPLFSEDWQYAFNDGTPTISGTWNVYLTSWWGQTDNSLWYA